MEHVWGLWGEEVRRGWLVEDFVRLECGAEGSRRLLWYLAAGIAPLWIKNTCRVSCIIMAKREEKMSTDHKVTVIMRCRRQGKLPQRDSNVMHIYFTRLVGRKKKKPEGGGRSRFLQGDPYHGSYTIKTNKMNVGFPSLCKMQRAKSPARSKKCKDYSKEFDHLKSSPLHSSNILYLKISNMYVMRLWGELTYIPFLATVTCWINHQCCISRGRNVVWTCLCSPTRRFSHLCLYNGGSPLINILI